MMKSRRSCYKFRSHEQEQDFSEKTFRESRGVEEAAHVVVVVIIIVINHHWPRRSEKL